MHAVIDAALPIFGLILTGFLCAKAGLLGPAATDSLNRFVVWLALPALLFQAMAQIAWEDIAQPGFLAAFAGGIAVCFVVSALIDRRAGVPLADISLRGLAASYANTGFMGIPLCLIALGEHSLPVAVIATLMTACVLFAVSILLIEIDLRRGRNVALTLVTAAASLVRNPLLITPAAGFAVAAAGLALPAPLLRFTTLLGAAASPCALVTIGLFLAQQTASRDVATVARLVGLKLVLQPAVTAVLAYKVFAIPPLWASAAVILSALPIGTGPFMLAKVYDREAAIVSQAILVSTVVSALTVSALLGWIG